jgi:hypothetical protein
MQKLLLRKPNAFAGIDTRFRTIYIVAIIEIGVDDVYPFYSSCLAGGNWSGHRERRRGNASDHIGRLLPVSNYCLWISGKRLSRFEVAKGIGVMASLITATNRKAPPR